MTMAQPNAKLERIFNLIDQAGGTKLPHVNQLDPKDKQTVIFNIWGAVFSIFYYFFHRMWKKGLVLGLISFVASIAVDIILSMFLSEQTLMQFGQFVSFGIWAAVFGTRANIDLYKKYRLNDDSWI